MDFEHCEKLIKEVIEENGLKNCTITASRGSAAGANYMGNIFKVTIIGIKNGQEEKLQLIVKSAPTDLALRNSMKVHDVYNREHFVYSKLFPAFELLQNKYRLTDAERSQHAKFLKHCNQELKETLVFEDLSIRGFRLSENHSFDRDHLFVAIKSLAKFHAVSIVLKDKCPDVFEETSKIGFDNEVYKEPQKSYVEKIRPAVLKACNNKPYKEKFMNFYNNMNVEFLRCSDPETTAPYNVVCHGDLKSNNLLFKYQNEKPVEMIILDYQLLAITTPVSDISFMLFSEMEKNVRNKHYDEILKLYYRTLSQNVAKMNTDINKYYPENVFWDHVKKYMKVGWILSLMLMPFIHGEIGKGTEFNDMINKVEDGGVKEAPITEFIQRRINEMIEDFIEYDMF